MGPELTPEFFVALAGIVVADLVLAGDNAVVIALAARNLPKDLRRRAVFFGAAAAILLRTVLTIVAVLVLGQEDIPLVRLVGGAALLYIGWQLAVEEQHDHEGIDFASTMRGAIRTILIADVVMSIDNVLAVAAFAKDDPWLVVFGLLVSIPIVMGGASLLLRVIDRFPLIVWIGAAMIVYVGMELVLVDPVVHDRLPDAITGWTERLIGIGVALVLTSVAWHRRTHDDDTAPRGDAQRDVEPQPDPPVVAASAAASTDRDATGPVSRLMVEGSDPDA